MIALTVVRKSVIAGIALALALLPACWDRREINDLAFVATGGYDVDNESLIVTTEIMRLISQEAGSSALPGTRQVFLVSGVGTTPGWAVRDLAQRVCRRVYWSHAEAVIFGVELARKGITQVLDSWDREADLRCTTNVFISEGTAKELLMNVQTIIPRSIGEVLSDFRKRQMVSGYYYVPQVYEVTTLMGSSSKTAIIPVIGVKEAPQPPIPSSPEKSNAVLNPVPSQIVEIKGLAVVKEGRLLEIVREPGIRRGIALGNGKVMSTMVTIPCPVPSFSSADVSNLVTFKVTATKVRRSAVVSGGSVSFQLQVDVSGIISDQGCMCDLTTKENTRAVEEAIGSALEEELVSAFQLSKTLKADFFSIGEAVHRKDPQYWRTVEKTWDEELGKVNFQCDVRVKITAFGGIRNPIFSR